MSKRGGAPRAKFIWSTTSTPPRAARAASSNLFLLAGNGELPAQRHPDHVALGRPDERLGFRNEPRFVIDPSHARDGLHRRHRIAASRFREGVRRKGDVAAGHLDLPLVEHRVLQRRVAARGKVGFHRSGIHPGRNHPKDSQRNHARPPFAAPPEKPVHSTSCGSGNREKTNPCEAVKLEITRNGPTSDSGPANCLFSGRPLILAIVARANHFRMKQLRHSVIRAGLEALYFTGAHYLLRPIFAGDRRHFHAASSAARPRRRVPAQPAPRGHARVSARHAVAPSRAGHRRHYHGRGTSAAGRTQLFAAVRLFHVRRRVSRQPGFRTAGAA